MRANHKFQTTRRIRATRPAKQESENPAQDDFYSAKTADELIARLIADKRASA